jgi:Na+-transporting NADH:ubiquinone oxidoreductase subunit NqrC
LTQSAQDPTPDARPPAETGAAPGASGSPALRWGMLGFLAVVAVLAAVVLVLEVVSLRPRAQEVDAQRQARSDVTRVAERFAVQVNNYDVASIDRYQSTITPMLSPKFKGEFAKAMTDIVASVKQAKMSSKGQVLTSAVASLDPDSAQVLVVSDASVKTVFDTRARHFRWEVSLVRIGGRWLVDNFTPVA